MATPTPALQLSDCLFHASEMTIFGALAAPNTLPSPPAAPMQRLQLARAYNAGLDFLQAKLLESPRNRFDAGSAAFVAQLGMNCQQSSSVLSQLFAARAILGLCRQHAGGAVTVCGFAASICDALFDSGVAAEITAHFRSLYPLERGHFGRVGAVSRYEALRICQGSASKPGFVVALILPDNKVQGLTIAPASDKVSVLITAVELVIWLRWNFMAVVAQARDLPYAFADGAAADGHPVPFRIIGPDGDLTECTRKIQALLDALVSLNVDAVDADPLVRIAHFRAEERTVAVPAVPPPPSPVPSRSPSPTDPFAADCESPPPGGAAAGVLKRRRGPDPAC